MGKKTPFGERLDRAIAANGTTARALAAALDVAETQISTWGSGRKKPGYEYLQALSIELGVSIDWLVHGPATSPSEAIAGRGRAALREVEKKDVSKKKGAG